MINPFTEIRRSKRFKEPLTEEVEGTFWCQQDGCYSVVTQAKYLSDLNILSWECRRGHINKIEGFEA
jgi:hypothetical protein